LSRAGKAVKRKVGGALVSFKPKERRRDVGRDARERKRERLDAAFDLARKIQADEIEKLRQAGFKGEKLKKKTPNLNELADSLLANHSDAIDRIVEEKKKQLAEMSKKAKSGISDARGRSLSSKKLESLASGFKDHLQRKKDSSEKKDDQAEKSASKQPSLKEIMDDARILRKEGTSVKDTGGNDGAKRLKELTTIRSMADFDEAVKRYPNLQYRENYQKQYKRVGRYLESDERKTRHKPKLLSFIEKKELLRAHEKTVGHPPDVRLESIEDVDRLLGVHSGRRNWKGFEEDYRKAKVYFEVRFSREKTTKLAKLHDVSQKRISEYKKLKEPSLISSLRRMEEGRIVKKWAESNLESFLRTSDEQTSEKSMKMLGQKELINPSSHIDSISIREKLSRISEGIEVTQLTDITEKMSSKISDDRAGLVFVNLDSLSQIIGNDRNLGQIIEDNKQAVELNLQKRLNLHSTDWHVRIGHVENRLYLWKLDRTPNDMLNVWSDHYFYFNRMDMVKMLDDFGQRLQLPEGRALQLRHLNKMIRTLASEDSWSQVRIERGQSRMMGDVLHLYRDIMAFTNQDFHGKMVKMTSRRGRGPIYTPRLPTGKELEVLRSQLGAAVNSDCWLGRNGIMSYHEANTDRIKIIRKQFQKLGEIQLKMEARTENRSFRDFLPRPIGKAFIFWEFTTGDKAAKNERLSRFIREGNRDVWIVYLRNLIPEDGSFNETTGFQWSRSIVLNPGTQDAKYNLESQLDDSHIAFIKDNGRRDKKRKYVHLQLSEHLNLDNESKSELVRDLESIIERNRCHLIDDEANLARNLGIDMRVYPESITLYEGTGRISIKWVAKTKDADNAIKWALIAPPNDVRKDGIVKDWLAQRQVAVERVRAQLKDGESLEKNGGPGEI
jgi:hypothetical protein